MQETRIPIDGEKLAKRWGIQPIDLLFMMMNHGLKAIDQLGDYVDMDIVFEVYGEDKENFDFPSLVFSLADVKKLEDEYLGDHLSMKRSVIRGQSLMNKWDMDGAEIFSIAFQEGWDFHDPFGFPIKEYYEFVLKLCNDQILKISDVLFELSDVEKFEKEEGPQLSKRNSVADSPFPEDKMDEKDGIPLISFYKNGQMWMIGRKDKEQILIHYVGFEFIRFLISYPNTEHDVLTVSNLGKAVNEEERNISGHVPDGVKIDSSHILGNGESGSTNDSYMDEDIDDKAVANYKNEIEILEEKLSVETDQENRLIIQDEINEIKKYLNAAKDPSNKVKKIRPQNRENLRTNIQRRIKVALDALEREIPYMKDYLNHETIKTGSKCSYKQDGSKPAEWILDPPQ